MKEKVDNQSDPLHPLHPVRNAQKRKWHNITAFEYTPAGFGKRKRDSNQLQKETYDENPILMELWQKDHGKLVEQSFSMTVIMMDCFSALNKTTLFNKVKTTKKDLCLLPDSQLIIRAKEIARLARKHLDVLEAYRIHALILDELDATIADFVNLTCPRDAIGNVNSKMAASHEN